MIKKICFMLFLLPIIALPLYRYTYYDGRIDVNYEDRILTEDEVEKDYPTYKRKDGEPCIYTIREYTIDTLRRSYFPFMKLHKGNVYKYSFDYDLIN